MKFVWGSSAVLWAENVKVWVNVVKCFYVKVTVI